MCIVGLLAYAALAVQLYRSQAAPERFAEESVPAARIAGPPARALAATADRRIERAVAALNDTAAPSAARIRTYEAELAAAEKLLLESLRVQPAQARSLARLAAVRWELDPQAHGAGASEVALIDLASEMAPGLPAVQQQLGELLLKMGRRQEAEQRFRRSVELDPATSEAVVSRMRDNLLSAEEILAALPPRPEVLAALLRPFLADGAEAVYLDALDAYLASGPPTADVLAAYGSTCVRTGESERLRDRMTALGTQDDPAIEAERLRQRSRAQVALGTTGPAVADARKAWRLQPSSYDHARFAGQVLAWAGQPDAAIAAYRDCLALMARGPSRPGARSAIYSGIGRAEESRGDVARAYDAYRMALRLDPEEPHAKRRLAEMRRAAESGATF